eukprot:scaffold130988_cov30-Tisochrysis_lutea.AAC.3
MSGQSPGFRNVRRKDGCVRVANEIALKKRQTSRGSGLPPRRADVVQITTPATLPLHPLFPLPAESLWQSGTGQAE